MKKYINIAFIYAIAAMAGGVFYREFTKFNGFTGVTALSKIHVHLFMLGMVVFLLVALFAGKTKLTQQKSFKIFFPVYNCGVALTAVMFLVRGLFQVLNVSLSAMATAMISGFAGLGHIAAGVGIICLFLALRKSADKA